MRDLTTQEKEAIAVLKTLSKRWPKSLWIFSGAGSLCVMKCGPDGERVMKQIGGGVDPDYVIATIDLPNDGGDW